MDTLLYLLIHHGQEGVDAVGLDGREKPNHNAAVCCHSPTFYTTRPQPTRPLWPNSVASGLVVRRSLLPRVPASGTSEVTCVKRPVRVNTSPIDPIFLHKVSPSAISFPDLSCREDFSLFQ